MRKVTEKTFKAYARDAVKELNTLELTAELEITALSAEITLLRDTKEVGHISIAADGWVYAKDFTRDEVFNIVPEHDTMKDLFSQIYPTVNGLLDNGWFWIETAEPQEAEQVEEVAEEPKKYFAVTFEKNGIYSANIAHAVKKSDVEAHYSKYNNCVIEEAKGYEVEEAKRKHMPIVEIEPVKEEVEKQEGRTITVTLHPEDEEEERTITYTGVKSISIATGKAAERIEAHTDESSIDKDHEYMVIIFNDHSKATFRRSSVVKVQEEGKLPVIEEEEDEPTAEEPQPTPEEADREVTYIDFKPEQDYEEERPPHAALEQLRRDSIEPPKIWSCKALKVQEILQKIYEGKTKTSGERLDAYYNHCYNLILASRIFLPECMYHYLERKLSNEMVIAGVCPAVIEEAFGYKKTRRKWYWKL